MYAPPGSPGWGGGSSGSKPGSGFGSSSHGNASKPSYGRATRYSAHTRDEYKAKAHQAPQARAGAYGGVVQSQQAGSRQQAMSAQENKVKDSIARLKASAMKAWDQPGEGEEQQ